MFGRKVHGQILFGTRSEKPKILIGARGEKPKILFGARDEKPKILFGAKWQLRKILFGSQRINGFLWNYFLVFFNALCKIVVTFFAVQVQMTNFFSC